MYHSNFVPKMCQFFLQTFNFKKCCDLDFRVRRHSRSLKVVPLDRLDMVSYYCAIVTLSSRRTVFEIFTFEKYRDLETWVRVTEGH